MVFNFQSKFYICLLLLCITFVACEAKQTDNQITNPTKKRNVLVLASEDEPGQRLEIFGSVIDSVTQAPIPKTKIFLYHADANGEYNLTNPDDESTAKFSGEIATDKNGEFVIKTILPREYELNGNKHIHLHYIIADGYKKDGGVILFDHDVNDEVREWATTTRFGFIIQLQELSGILNGNLVIQLVPKN